MAGDLGNNSGYASEINITPLVDVVLVLLIIFMMIVPVMMHGYDVDIPGEAPLQAPRDDRTEQIVLRIDIAECPWFDPPPSAALPTNCTVRLNDEPVRVTDLAGRVTETFATREGSGRVLFLAAHDRLNYEGVLRILDVARSGTEGIRIGLVAESG